MNSSAFSIRKHLLLTLPEISTLEIWNDGFCYYLKVTLEEGATLKSISGKIAEILNDLIPVGSKYTFGEEDAPIGYKQFLAPTELALISESTGYTKFDTVAALNVLFPGSRISSIEEEFSSQSFALIQQPEGRELSLEQINSKIGFITISPNWRVGAIEHRPLPEAIPQLTNKLNIIPSGLLGEKHWREAAERDEEFSQRFQYQAAEGKLRLDPEKRASVFVDDSMKSPIAVRPLLAVFDRVILSPSISGDWNLDISPDEAITLAAMGKLQVACPRNPCLYASNFVRTIAEECPLSLIGPRATGLLAFSESVRRNPILKQLLVDVDEARILLKVLEAVTFDDPRLMLLNQVFIRSMKHEALDALHYNFVRGSLLGGVYGMGAIANEVHKVLSGETKNLGLEFTSVGERVQIGAGFDAYIQPWESQTFLPYYEYISKLVNTKAGHPMASPEIGEILHGLDIPVYYDLPIEEYIGLFNDNVTLDIRSLLIDIISKTESPAKIRDVAVAFRERSNEVQIRSAQISRLGIVGALVRHVPLHWSLLNMALNFAIGQGLDELGKLRSVQTNMDAVLAKAFEIDITSVRLARIRTDIRARRYGKLPQWLWRRFVK